MQTTQFDPLRVQSVAEALSYVDEKAVDVIEASDPQYKSLARLARAYGVKAVFFAVANALVSYRLLMTGEEYWTCYADSLLARAPEPPADFEEALDLVVRFLSECKGSRMMLKQKLARISRAQGVLRRIYENPLAFSDLSRLVSELTMSLGGKGDEKTIVFAAKMAYYVYRSLSVTVTNQDKVPIPLDRRMAILTSTSRMLRCSVSTIMTRCRSNAVKAWSLVAQASGIPSLHLDAVVWLPAQHIERLLSRGLEVAREEYARRLTSLSHGLISWKVASRVAKEVLYDYPIR